MFPADEFSGHALRDDALRDKIYSLVAPHQKVCGDCQFLPYCMGCYLRGYIKYQETQCAWGKSQNIDEIFAALRSDGEKVTDVCSKEAVAT
jgi:hypothetical protein